MAEELNALRREELTMTKRQIVLIVLVALVGCALCGGAVVVASQQQLRPSDSSDAAVSALVVELRALRADLAEAAQRSLRSQLLLGRLQMQEQRLTYLDRQRSEATAALMQQTTITSGIASQVRTRESCDASPDPKSRSECELMMENFKRQLSAQQKMEHQLRARESDLLNTVATEQALWTDFNARLDDLERALIRR
jgi:hypothetical protein